MRAQRPKLNSLTYLLCSVMHLLSMLLFGAPSCYLCIAPSAFARSIAGVMKAFLAAGSFAQPGEPTYSSLHADAPLPDDCPSEDPLQLMQRQARQSILDLGNLGFRVLQCLTAGHKTLESSQIGAPPLHHYQVLLLRETSSHHHPRHPDRNHEALNVKQLCRKSKVEAYGLTAGHRVICFLPKLPASNPL